ncbi:MAG: chemotaxis response regulator protein-glutamate methylesterase [Pseudomonadota bacterium]|nr:chemotaxis response regulator protein-glutamate methylesterase [Pseudomonadota bacterium]
MDRPRRVLIVDDSATMRRLIRTGLEVDRRLQIVGEASTAREARDLVKSLMPDIMTLDIEMPGMDGLEFLDRLMKARPMPVVMVSSLTAKGSEAAIRALSLGALDCVEKPRFGAAQTTFAHLAELLYVLSGSPIADHRARGRSGGAAPDASFRWNGKLLLIGSSTGGVDALERVFSQFPANCPPTLVTQHMPEQFLVSFAARLDSSVFPSVRVAHDAEEIRQGEILLAPGGSHHLHVDRSDMFKIRLSDRPKRSGHRPSVDEMFMSAIPHAALLTAGVLTGMGRDGADGLLALRQAGASTFAQNRETCVVYGMPRVAAEIGAVQHVLPLSDIAGRLLLETKTATKAEREASE